MLELGLGLKLGLEEPVSDETRSDIDGLTLADGDTLLVVDFITV